MIISVEDVSAPPPLMFVGGTVVPEGDVSVVFVGLLFLSYAKMQTRDCFRTGLKKRVDFPFLFWGVLFEVRSSCTLSFYGRYRVDRGGVLVFGDGEV